MNLNEFVTQHPYLTASVLAVLLITQGTWMFLDAKKRGEKRYWLWGLFGMLNIPTNLILYLIVTRVLGARQPKIKCSACHRKIEGKSKYCRFCGYEVKAEE